MAIIIIILSLLFLIYAGLLVFILSYWHPSLLKENEVSPLHDFSIIIPTRNESTNIKTCINSVLSCAYDKNKIEIIVVDDHSTDNTLQQLCYFENQIKVLNAELQGKKAALSLGIKNSKFEHIVTLDADCIVPKNWLKSLSAEYHHTQPSIITAPVCIIRSPSALNAFEYLETCGLMAVTNLGIKTNSFPLGNGANFSFLKTFFSDVNGYGNHQNFASGDDVYLIKSAFDNNEKVSFLLNSDAVVKTKGCHNVKMLLDQRKRWATKTRSYASIYLLLVQTFVFASNFVIPLLLLASIVLWDFNLLLLFVASFAIKAMIDYFYLHKICKLFEGITPVFDFMVSTFINLYVYVYMSYHALFPGKYEWKQRKTK